MHLVGSIHYLSIYVTCLGRCRYSAMANSPRAPSLPAAFSVTYTNPPQLTGAFWYSWQTMLIVLLILVRSQQSWHC